MRAIDADAIAYESIDSCGTGRHEHYYGTGIIAVRKEDIDAMPTIQPDNGLQKLADEIATFKRCVKSENSDYLTGYLCALSAVEGMIAERREVTT